MDLEKMRNSLRKDPEEIIIGEIRGKEAEEMLKVMISGHYATTFYPKNLNHKNINK